MDGRSADQTSQWGRIYDFFTFLLFTIMHLYSGLLLLISIISAASAVSITASDLPECAVECYCLTAEKETIPVTEYEEQCRSSRFQVALRDCAQKDCSPDEYAFVRPF